MLDDGALAVSFPVVEWKTERPPGSVFRRRDFVAENFSVELSRGLDLINSACALAGFEPLFVARPEMFTHGETLAWLMERIGPVRDHLCLSDGATIKLIPGLRNHVFFHGLSRSADCEALTRLGSRFPEIFAPLHGQVNSALRLGSGDAPAPIAIEGAKRDGREATFYPIALQSYFHSSHLRSARRGEAAKNPPRGFDELTYVPLTDAGLKDAEFMKSIAAVYDFTYFDASRGLILRVPETVGGSAVLEDRFDASLAALVESGSRAPLAPARNAWMASDDLSNETIAGAARTVKWLAHDSFDFWRAGSADYRAFQSLSIVARRDRHLGEDFGPLTAALCGREVEIVWRDPPGEPRR